MCVCVCVWEGGYLGRAHIFHVWSSLVVTITSLLGCIVTLHRGGEGTILTSRCGFHWLTCWLRSGVQ